MFIAKNHAMQTWYYINCNNSYHKSIESYIYKNIINKSRLYKKKINENINMTCNSCIWKAHFMSILYIALKKKLT